MKNATLNRPGEQAPVALTSGGSLRQQPAAKEQTVSRRKIEVLVGLLFLWCTITFAIGNMLLKSYFSGGHPGSGTLVAGVLLEACTGFAVAGIGVAVRSLLRPHGPRLPAAYLVFRVLEGAAILAVGVYFVASRAQWRDYEVVVYAFSGAAGLVLSFLLLRSRLVPRWLAILGIAGYAALLLGAASTALGITDIHSGAGVLFLAPGGLFELVFPLLLIFKGLEHVSPNLDPAKPRSAAEVAA
jgi:hypothetical protein